MNIRSSICIALFLSLCFGGLFRSTAFGQSAFQEFITFPLGDTLASFVFAPTPNGGFGAFHNWSGDGYFIRTDGSGLPTWAGTVHFDTPLLPVFGNGFSAMPDGGALVRGPDLYDFGQASWLRHGTSAARIATDGQLLWSKQYILADSQQFGGSVYFEYSAFPDGTALAYGVRTTQPPYVLFVMKIDQQGMPLWTTSVDVTSIGAAAPMLLPYLMPDGACAFLYVQAPAEPALHVIRLDGNGGLAWAFGYEMTNAPWEVWATGMKGDTSGNLAISSYRSNSSLNYGDLLWLSPTGNPYRHRLDADGVYAESLLAWNGAEMWMGRRAIDSTGASIVGGYSLINPGTFANTDHTFLANNQHVMNDDLWLGGQYRVVDNTFGYQVFRPFLMKTPSMAITGCRLSPLPSAPVNFIDVPDSLLEVTALNLPWWQTTTNVADTAVVVQDRNPNSIYDLCAIVGVREEAMPSFTANVWPDPLPQGAWLNVDASEPTDLVIHDLGGRIALQLLDQRTTRQLSTSAFEPGTYIATGRDQHGARLWARPFVVL